MFLVLIEWVGLQLKIFDGNSGAGFRRVDHRNDTRMYVYGVGTMTNVSSCMSLCNLYRLCSF